MNDILPFIIIGIATGAVYGLAGVGLVLTYKTSGIFNFAHGALATVAAFAFYYLHVQENMAWPLAAVISVVILGVALGLGFEVLARGLSRTTLALRIAATVGIMLFVIAIFTIMYGANARTYPQFLPTTTFRVVGVNVGYDQVIITLISLIATAALYVFFRAARLGKAMRAVVDDPDLLDVAGTSPRTVRRWAWIIGCFFATLSGLLLAPSIDLSPSGLTLLVVQAFGAAAIGGFSSLPLTWGGGLAIGIGSSLITKYVSSTSILSGLSSSLPFIVLFLVILIYPRARLAVRQATAARRPAQWRAQNRVQIGVGIAVLALLIAVPSFAGFHISEWTTSLAYVVLLLSLGLLVRTSGQVSLAQMSFAAIGAVGFSKLSTGPHLPWLVALILAGLIAVPIGALLAIPAIRLAGLYLALGTFGFGLLLQDMFYQSNVMFGVSDLGLKMPMPSLSWIDLRSSTGFYYLVLAITALVSIAVVVLVRSRLGRLLRAMADSPTALTTGGTSVTATRVLVFCISAFIAAIAGALIGMVLTVATGSAFDPLTSLSLLALVLIIPTGEPWFAIIGGLGLGLVPGYISSANINNYLSLIFGLSAVLVALGLIARLPDRARTWFDALGRPRHAQRGFPAQAEVASEHQSRPLSLTVEHLTVQFGGLVAVRDLSLSARSGAITGLIGPNGSGKTTTFNACSGLNRPRNGRILLNDKDVSHQSAARRARRGIGRTFQIMELYESLTVLDNVAMGYEAARAGSHVLSQVLAPPADRAASLAAAQAALSLCQIDSLAEVQVSSLSTGQRRLVELARCIAGPFDLLLLDEPSSGLDRVETGRFAEILRHVVQERNLGVLLVEHDMSLVLDVCDDIYVLNFGSLLFHGTPAELQRSPEVRAAYLGTSVVQTDQIEETVQ